MKFSDCLFVLPLLCLVSSTALFGQTAKERSVEVSVALSENPPKFQFSWPEDPTATDYQVYRKSLDDADWGSPIASLPGDATTFSDSGIDIGIGYEYAFFKKGFDLVIDTFCLTPGTELRFDVADMYGIGLCCNFGFGYYKVEACGQTLAYGDDFGLEASTVFDLCDSGNTCEEVVVTIAPDLFPNSTSWTLHNNATGETLASSGDVGDFITERPKYGYIYSGIRLPHRKTAEAYC